MYSIINIVTALIVIAFMVYLVRSLYADMPDRDAVVGPPTKSEILHQFAKEQGIDVVDLALSDVDPEDFKGIPIKFNINSHGFSMPNEEQPSERSDNS